MCCGRSRKSTARCSACRWRTRIGRMWPRAFSAKSTRTISSLRLRPVASRTRGSRACGSGRSDLRFPRQRPVVRIAGCRRQREHRRQCIVVADHGLLSGRLFDRFGGLQYDRRFPVGDGGMAHHEQHAVGHLLHSQQQRHRSTDGCLRAVLPLAGVLIEPEDRRAEPAQRIPPNVETANVSCGGDPIAAEAG